MIYLPAARLGSSAWVRQTNGALSCDERWELMEAMLGWTLVYAYGLVRLWLRLVPSSVPKGVGAIQKPDTPLVRATDDAWARQTDVDWIKAHSYRSWLIGLLLARLAGDEIEEDLFYCAALLHDFGLINPSRQADFTAASAGAAIACAKTAGLAKDRIAKLEEAICVHPTIGVSRKRDTLGYYVQWGAMADIAGLRRWKVGRSSMTEIVQRHPYGENFKAALYKMLDAEAQAFPDGRFALYRSFGLKTLIRLAPLVSA